MLKGVSLIKHFLNFIKAKSNPIPGLDRSWGFHEAEAPRFQDNRHMKVVRLSALRTGHLYPPGNIPGTHFCYKLSQPQGHSATRRIMSMKNSNDIGGNRTRDLPTRSAVPQPTAPPRNPPEFYATQKFSTACQWLLYQAKRTLSTPSYAVFAITQFNLLPRCLNAKCILWQPEFFCLAWIFNVKRENQQDATNSMFIIKFLSQHVSGIIMPIIRRIRPCPTACGVLPVRRGKHKMWKP